ncbi:unnamed protein product [Staurois parvus]|uniref:Uncharacterized protein n=1 Tax=Staurois parvus TaxID=386267 RepID=A0ABN9EIL0_9NEOB|nr:unnamed protein product [Staurois parvus]
MCDLPASGPRRRAAAHLCSIKKGHMCRERASCALPAHMSGTHETVPISYFDRDLPRSCDRRDGASHDPKPRPASQHLEPLKGREAPA